MVLLGVGPGGVAGLATFSDGATSDMGTKVMSNGHNHFGNSS